MRRCSMRSVSFQNLRNEQKALKEKLEDYKDKLSCSEKQKKSLKQVLVKYIYRHVMLTTI
jgi:hypothetical protein